MKLPTLLCAMALSLGGLGMCVWPAQSQSAAQNPPLATSKDSGEVRTTMKNVQYHLTDKIIVNILALNGKLTPEPNQMVLFDDKQSFVIDVDSASVTLSTTTLTNDLNDYVFAKPDAPLKNLVATIQGDELTVKGLLVSKGGVPFESSGTLAATPEGKIRVHTTKLKALHLPVKGLLDLLGLDTANMVNTKAVEGVSFDKDDMILDPEQILPPPRLRGFLNSIKIQNGAIALTFAPPTQKASQPPLTNNCGARNYLQFKGGSVRFGKLTMADSDLLMMQTEPVGLFDFAIDHYKDQLVAGYSKMTPQGGLCVHMPDFNKLKPHAIPEK